MDYKIAFKILIYLAITSSVFLFLRYFPFTKLSVIQSLIITILIVSFCFVLEKLSFMLFAKIASNFLDDDQE